MADSLANRFHEMRFSLRELLILTFASALWCLVLLFDTFLAGLLVVGLVWGIVFLATAYVTHRANRLWFSLGFFFLFAWVLVGYPLFSLFVVYLAFRIMAY